MFPISAIPNSKIMRVYFGMIYLKPLFCFVCIGVYVPNNKHITDLNIPISICRFWPQHEVIGSYDMVDTGVPN